MKFWQKTLLGVFAIGLVGSAGYWGYRSTQPTSDQQTEKPQMVKVYLGDVKQTINAPGSVVSMQHADLKAAVEGEVEEVFVFPGSSVKKDEIMMRLGNLETYEANVASTKVEFLKAQQELDELLSNPSARLAKAEIALLDAKEKLETARKKRTAMDYPRGSKSDQDGAYKNYEATLGPLAEAKDAYARLAADDPQKDDAYERMVEAQEQTNTALGSYNWLSSKPSAQETARVDAEIITAQATYDAANRDYEQMKNGETTLEEEIAQAKVAELEAKYQKAEADLESLEVKAPFDGVVSEVNVNVGDLVSPKSELASLLNPQALEVQVSVTEDDLPFLQNGQAAELYFDALPEALVNSSVERIIPSRLDNDRPIYPVYLSLKEIPANLVAGMTVDALIRVEERKNVLALPRAVVRVREDGTAIVDVWVNNQRETRTIQVGLIGDQSVEVLDGLAEGDEVVSE